MNAMNPNSEVALYKQLAQILISRIQTEDLKPGDKLPTETELVEQYHVSRITVRAALKNLEEDGVLVRSQGKGTFVASPKAYFKADDHVGFTKSCMLIGKFPGTKLLKREHVLPTASVRDFLQIGENEKVIMTERLHFVDHRPIAIETNYYANTLGFILTEDLEGSPFELLKSKYHISAEHRDRTLAVCTATTYEAGLLELKRRTPLLLFKDRLVDGNNTPLYFSKQVYCTENMEFYIY